MTRWGVSRLALMSCVLLPLIASAIVANGVIRAHRYAEWRVVNRDIAEGLALVAPIAAIIAAVVAARALKPSLLWFSAGLARSRVHLLRTAAVIAAATAAGWLLGLAPMLVWAESTSSYGGPSPLVLLAAFAGLIAASLLAQALTLVSGTFWAGAMVATLLLAGFYVGRLQQAPFQLPTTPLIFLPFDGTTLPLDTGRAVRLAVTSIRLIAAVTLVCFAIFVLARAAGVERRGERIRRGLMTPATFVVGAALVAAALPHVELSQRVAQPMVCRRQIGPPVCVFAEHSRDLPVLARMIERLYRAGGQELLPARAAVEGADWNGRAVMAISVPTDTLTEFTESVSTQLGSWVSNYDQCINGHASAASKSLDDLIGTWFAWQAGYDLPPALRTAELVHWNDDPAHANAVFRAHAALIQSCRITARDLR